MEKRHGIIGFIIESAMLTALSRKMNLLDKQLTDLYLRLGLVTYNISAGISNDTKSADDIKRKITSLKQDIASLTKQAEERGLSRGKRANASVNQT